MTKATLRQGETRHEASIRFVFLPPFENWIELSDPNEETKYNSPFLHSSPHPTFYYLVPTFEYSVIDRWPPLAWLASLQVGHTPTRVKHGRGIEILENGFCEAVWDGSFSDLECDQTDVVFGSAARSNDKGIVFVSSGTTVDRLHWFQTAEQTFVSNSLACLLQEIRATVDAAYDGYFAFFESIVKGTKDYQSSLATTQGDVRLTYYDNLQWDGKTLTPVKKTHIDRSFDTFEDYHGFLIATMERLGQNLSDPSRQFSLQPLATISTGYDSPTCAAVGRAAGLRETLSIARGRGDVEDDGSAIASSLGLSPIVAERNVGVEIADDTIAGERNSNLMPLFIASDAKGRRPLLCRPS